jgi:hypothetical protein
MEVAFQVCGDMVIVEQRVVDVKKENDFLVRHGPVPLL